MLSHRVCESSAFQDKVQVLPQKLSASRSKNWYSPLWTTQALSWKNMILVILVLISSFVPMVAVYSLAAKLCPTLCDPMDCLCPLNSPGKNTGMGCYFLLQGIFLTQDSNLGLLHYRQILYQLSYEGNPELNTHSPK